MSSPRPTAAGSSARAGRGRRVSVWQAIVLGIVQGLTEFLPVSSSAHLLIVPWLLGWEEPGLAFDAALHLGTLAAVLVYFWRELVAMAVAFPRAILRPGAVLRSRDPADVMPRLSLLIAIGTVPGLAFGLLGQETIDAVYHPGGVTPDRVIVAIAVALIALALLLLWAERAARHVRQMDSLTVRDAVVIGLAQAGGTHSRRLPLRGDDHGRTLPRPDPRRRGPLLLPAGLADHRRRGGQGSARHADLRARRRAARRLRHRPGRLSAGRLRRHLGPAALPAAGQHRRLHRLSDRPWCAVAGAGRLEVRKAVARPQSHWQALPLFVAITSVQCCSRIDA